MNPYGESVIGTTTITSPAWDCSIAACTIRLSPGAVSTVIALPAIAASCWMGRMRAPA